MIEITAFPAINASLNALSMCAVITGAVMIARGKKKAHAIAMIAAVCASALFLAGYLYYHYHHGSTRYQGQGILRTVYFSILISHTILAAVIVPMILRTVYLAAKKQYEKHRKIAKITLPLWLYVSFTGVVIYWMLYRM